MSQRLTAVLLSALAIIACASQASATQPQKTSGPRQDYPVREELNRTFQFTAFGQVAVSGIAGDVSIETHGGNTVDVHVLRSAETQAELDCYQTVIEHANNSLTIRHEQSKEGRCNNIRAGQRVTLRVPRAIDVTLKTIAGMVNVDPIDGVIGLQGIAGHATLAQVREAKIDGLANGLMMSITQPTARGIQVSGIVGRVDLTVAPDVNADLSVSSVIDVDNKTSGVTITKVASGNGKTRFGVGGPLISISGIVGSVRINP